MVANAWKSKAPGARVINQVTLGMWREPRREGLWGTPAATGDGQKRTEATFRQQPCCNSCPAGAVEAVLPLMRLLKHAIWWCVPQKGISFRGLCSSGAFTLAAHTHTHLDSLTDSPVAPRTTLHCPTPAPRPRAPPLPSAFTLPAYESRAYCRLLLSRAASFVNWSVKPINEESTPATTICVPRWVCTERSQSRAFVTSCILSGKAQERDWSSNGRLLHERRP